MFLSVMVCRWMANAAKTTGIVFMVCPFGCGLGHIRPLTVPISNAGSGDGIKVLSIFMMSPNQFDLAFEI